MSSYKVEVIADSSGTWSSNALRFATRTEAEAYGRDLFSRWFAVREWRTVSCDDPVTDQIDLATGVRSQVGG